jgi:hypothetical protein
MRQAMVDCGVTEEKIDQVMELYRERHPDRPILLRASRAPGILAPASDRPSEAEILATVEPGKISDRIKDEIRASRRTGGYNGPAYGGKF